MADYRMDGSDFLSKCEPYDYMRNERVSSRFKINGKEMDYTKYPYGYSQARAAGGDMKYLLNGNCEFSAKGYYPTTCLRAELTTVGTHTIVFENGGVYALINGSSSNKVELVPTSCDARIILVGLFGGGGGGGGGAGRAGDSGCGGGGGAAAYGLLSPQNFYGYNITVTIGQGGGGGTVGGQGGGGGATSIVAVEQTYYRMYGTVANGGGGGGTGGNGRTGVTAGGSYGTVPNAAGDCLHTVKGCNGGAGSGDGMRGNSCTMSSKRYTPASNYHSIREISNSGGSGNYGGGGGGGSLGNGGSGGPYGNNGSAGSKTGGGGGGAYSLWLMYGGGSGGNGSVKFYY